MLVIFYRTIVIVKKKLMIFLDWRRNLVLIIPKVVRGTELNTLLIFYIYFLTMDFLYRYRLYLYINIYSK